VAGGFEEDMSRVKKLSLILLILAVIVFGGLGFIFFKLNSSIELQAARLVCHEYAKHKNFNSEWSWVKIRQSWAKRGSYKLSCFLFSSSDAAFPYLIIVRYTEKCPTNNFEVGTIRTSSSRSCTADTVISDPEFIAPP
jgi:hypothetical protein